MMRTEDDARVSLEDTFNSETDSPETSGKGSAKDGNSGVPGSPSKQKASRAASGQWQRKLGPWVGGETWEETGTSWVLSDICLILWRVATFGAMLGVFIAKQQSGEVVMFSRDCYVGSLFASGLLLTPCAMLLFHGPHFDDLDSREVRWLWSIVAASLQIVFSMVLFVTAGYSLLTGRKGNGVHYLLVILLGLEYVAGCISPKLGYAAMSWALMVIQMFAAGEGLRGGLGPWANVWLARGGGRRYLAAVLAQGGVAVLVFGVGKIRTAVAERLERAEGGSIWR